MAHLISVNRVGLVNILGVKEIDDDALPPWFYFRLLVGSFLSDISGLFLPRKYLLLQLFTSHKGRGKKQMQGMGSSTSPSSLDATGVESKNTASSTAEVQVATKPTPVDYEREKDAASSDPELNDDGVIKEPETKKPAITGTPAVAPAITYPSGLLASILNIALLLSLFLVALDMVSTLLSVGSRY